MRAIINQQYMSNLSENGHSCVIMFAQDRFTSKRKNIALDPALQHELRELPDSPALYPGFLQLTCGVEVMILENIYPDLLIMNGSIGTVKSMSPQQRPTTSLDKAFVIVEFEWLKRLDIQVHQDLPLGCVIFKPSVCHFQHKKVHYSRLQFPMCLSKSMTIHKCQGKTAKEGIVLCSDNRITLPMMYVALSRVQSLRKLLIYGPITRDIFQTKWPQDLKLELKRQKTIQDKTLEMALHHFPSQSLQDASILLEEQELD